MCGILSHQDIMFFLFKLIYQFDEFAANILSNYVTNMGNEVVSFQVADRFHMLIRGSNVTKKLCLE